MARGTFYVTEKIGPKQSLTPEGFLLCEEVPIARTGMMLYGADETPVKANADGIAKIFRDEEDIFNPITMASANGKSITDEHPDTDVVPENWKELTHGVAFNPRRGTGAADDLLYVDFLITTPEGIEAVQAGKREVSCGYEADYEDNGDGTGKQSSIIFNHIALVEQGRCGPRCAIGDHQPLQLKGNKMAATKKVKTKGILDTLMRAFKAKDAEEVEQLASEVADDFGGPVEGLTEGGDTHIHIHANGQGSATSQDDDLPEAAETTDDGDDERWNQNAAEHADIFARLEALEAKVAGGNPAAAAADDGEELTEEMKDEMPDDVKDEEAEEAFKAKDSSIFSNSFVDTVAMAEILVPGIKVPTFDRKMTPGKTFKAICALRTQALDLAYVQPATRAILDELLGGKVLNTSAMTCDAVRNLFRSASAVKSAANKKAPKTNDTTKTASPLTLAEVNRRNRELYASKI